MNNTFLDTVPVKRPQQVTPAEGQNIIRGSWPDRRSHDYTMHTAECDECADDDNGLPGVPIALLMFVALIVIAVVCAAAIAMVLP